jgi:nitrogen fixation protein NifX
MVQLRRLRIVRYTTSRGERLVEKSSAVVRVAFTTTDLVHVDQHFGSARACAIHEVGADWSRLVEVVEFDEGRQDGNEAKLPARIDALRGVVAVFCQAVGHSAVNQLLASSIQPVKVSEGALLGELIEGLQEELRNGPTSWLARAIKRDQRDDESRFDGMEAEGWQE